MSSPRTIAIDRSRLPGVRAVVGAEGLLVEPGDVASLAAALAEMSSDGEKRRALGQAARKKAVNTYDWPHVAWWASDGFHVIDLWNSKAAFEDFMQNRLAGGIQRAGIQGQPHVELSEAHAIFAPNV